MNRTLHKGDQIRFDPTLSVTINPDALFKTPRVHCKVTGDDALNFIDEPISIRSWELQGDDGSLFWLMEDKTETTDVWFLLRLVGESEHDQRMPDWLTGETYDVATPTGTVVPFGYYSPAIMAKQGEDDLLFRAYVRPVGDTEEFLWIVLRNDAIVQHWVGVVIDPAQILPG